LKSLTDEELLHDPELAEIRGQRRLESSRRSGGSYAVNSTVGIAQFAGAFTA